MVVDVVATRQSGNVHVIFVAGEDGMVRKLSVMPSAQHTCLLEILAPFPKNSSVTIHSMKFLKDTVSALSILKNFCAYMGI